MSKHWKDSNKTNFSIPASLLSSPPRSGPFGAKTGIQKNYSIERITANFFLRVKRSEIEKLEQQKFSTSSNKKVL
jgi:ribosomal protein L33